ncbi:MAG: secretin N-terminal domain-containing protein [bacterium]
MKIKKRLSIILLLIMFFSIEGQSAEKIPLEEDELEKTKEIKFYSLEKEYRKIKTQKFTLKNAVALELKPIIESMLSIYGSVYVNEKDNIVYVTDTPEMIESLEPIIREFDIKGIKAGGNFVSSVILLNHTDASHIIDLVKHKLSKDGKILKVGDLNGLIITDIPSKIEEVKDLIRNLDVPIKHILIEITILELNWEFYKKVGLDIMGWLDRMYPEIRYQKTQYKYEDNTPNHDSKEFSFTISPRFNISDIIELMIRDGEGRVLASPKIITKNNNLAYLDASEIIPYSPSDNSYSPGREMTVKAGVYLSVLPIVQQDNFINLRISPRISDFTGWSPKGMPIIFQRSMNTEVNVKDGETFVLGGLRKTEKVEDIKGIPILKKIPLLKYLFSKTVKVDLTREVVMFITPYIIKEGIYFPEKDKELLKKMEENIKR